MLEYRLNAILQAESSHIKDPAEKARHIEQTPFNKPPHGARELDLPTTKDGRYDRLSPSYTDLVFAQALR